MIAFIIPNPNNDKKFKKIFPIIKTIKTYLKSDRKREDQFSKRPKQEK